MKSIDFKSLLIGILGTALVLVLMGQSSDWKERMEYKSHAMVMADAWEISCFPQNTYGGKCAVFRNDLQKFVGIISTKKLTDITEKITTELGLQP